MGELLTKDERVEMQSMKEDYLDILYNSVNLRKDNPILWHTIVTQWEILKLKLEDDEHQKVISTADVTVENDDE